MIKTLRRNCSVIQNLSILSVQFYHYYQKEFVKAVDAWRNRGSVPAQIAADSGGARATDKENIPVKVTMGGASAAALAMAAKIATELEVEQQVFRKRMSEQREALEASIKQNEEMALKLQGDSMLSEEKSSLRERDEQSDKKSHQPNMHVSVQIDDDNDDDDCDFNERKQVTRVPTGKQCSPKQSPSGTDMRGKWLYRFVVTIYFTIFLFATLSLSYRTQSTLQYELDRSCFSSDCSGCFRLDTVYSA